MTKPKFHITKAGRADICNANERACPLGGEHYDSMTDAMRASMAKDLDNFDQVEAVQQEQPQGDSTRLDVENLMTDKDLLRYYAETTYVDNLVTPDRDRLYDPVTVDMVVDYLQDGGFEGAPRGSLLWEIRTRSGDIPSVTLEDELVRISKRRYPSNLHTNHPGEAKHNLLKNAAEHHKEKKKIDMERRGKLADAEIEEKKAAIKKQNRSFGQLGEERAKKRVEAEFIAIKEKLGGELNHILLSQDRDDEIHDLAAESYEAWRAADFNPGPQYTGPGKEFYDALPPYNSRADLPDTWKRESWTAEDHRSYRSWQENNAVRAEVWQRIEERDPARFERWEKMEHSNNFHHLLDEDEYKQVMEEVREAMKQRHLGRDDPNRNWRLAQNRDEHDWEKRIRAEYLYGERGNE